MMRALLAKELRSLRPFALCIAGMLVLILLFTIATGLPDVHVFDPSKWLSDDRNGAFGMLAIFGLMIGAGLLINESEQGTLRFLDGLPLSRTRVFVAKVLAAFATIALVPILGVSIDVALDFISRSSLNGPFPWRFVATEFALQLIAGAYFVALALVVSFLRHWFALVVGLLLWAYLGLQMSGVHWIALFNPRELLGVGLDGARVLVPWRHVAAHLGAMAAFLAVAWMGFQSLGDRVQFAAQSLVRWRVLRALGASLRWVAPLLWVAALVRLVGNSPNENAGGAANPVGETAFAREETRRYEFLFRSAQRADAKPLLAAADEVHDAVADFLGVAPPAVRIVVDLASPVIPHAAGQTNWTKIRLPLAAEQQLAEQKLILGHETVHVFIEQLSDGRLSGHFRYARFLHEGLATHVEQHLFAEPEQHAQNRRSVAAAWARGAVPFGLLGDDEELRRKRDPNLAYPLGEVFARVLIESQGRAAPAKLLRAFARKNAPAGLKGAALWRDTMQAAGLDLDRVIAAYESACAQLAVEEKAFTDKLPRVSATVKTEGGEIVIRPKFDGVAPGELICLIGGEDALDMTTPELPRRADGSFALPRHRLLKPSIRYLLGWHTPETRLPVFEPWAEAAL